MSAEFWAGYVSGAIGIVVGNPLDLIKTRLQVGPRRNNDTSKAASASRSHVPWASHFERCTALVRGAAGPILGYGALNALLFVAYNRSLVFLNTTSLDGVPEEQHAPAWSLWTAGALGGLATFFVSTPTELVKCRAQVSDPPKSSLDVTKELLQCRGMRGLYLGGRVTSVRDSVGYGFYFWSYELSKRYMTSEGDGHTRQTANVLLCGGLAGVVTWASIFPLDVIKTRVQTYDLLAQSNPPALVQEAQPLLNGQSAHAKRNAITRPSTYHIALEAYRAEGISVFFKGLGICSARAFIVNAVQWAVYEYMRQAILC